MKKIIVWVKTLFLALPMFFSSLHARKQPFSIVYETARLWTLMFLKNAKVKIRLHHKNHLPLKEGIYFVVINGSSIDQEVILSSMGIPFVAILSHEKRLFLISKSWQNKLKTMVNPTQIDKSWYENNRNIINFTDTLDTVNETGLSLAMEYNYPIVLIDINNAERALDTQVLPRVVVDVNFHIPIVQEEYKEYSLTELKLMMHKRKEGNMYEHD